MVFLHRRYTYKALCMHSCVCVSSVLHNNDFGSCRKIVYKLIMILQDLRFSQLCC
jgi:hypothetical protein